MGSTLQSCHCLGLHVLHLSKTQKVSLSQDCPQPAAASQFQEIEFIYGTLLVSIAAMNMFLTVCVCSLRLLDPVYAPKCLLIRVGVSVCGTNAPFSRRGWSYSTIFSVWFAPWLQVPHTGYIPFNL